MFKFQFLFFLLTFINFFTYLKYPDIIQIKVIARQEYLSLKGVASLYSINNTIPFTFSTEQDLRSMASLYFDSNPKYVQSFIFSVPKKEMYDELRDNGIKTALFNIEEVIESDLRKFNYLHHKFQKLYSVYYLLTLGYTVLYVDTDFILQGDILAAAQNLSYMDMYFANDNRGRSELCNGFMYIHSTENKRIFKNAFQYIASNNNRDQPSLVHSIRDYKATYGVVPFKMVENGLDFFNNVTFDKGIIIEAL
jgi:hypothetical protein